MSWFSSKSSNEKSSVSSENHEEKLKQFISQAPQLRYTFDSERDASQSELCREEKNRKQCINLHMHSKKLFEAMQELGFYCALPSDPSRTHMECTPIPKV